MDTESVEDSKTVSLHNPHTDEAADITFWQNGAYNNAALDKAQHLLRDHRTQEETTISPRLLELLYAITHRQGITSPMLMSRVFVSGRPKKKNGVAIN